MKDNDKQSFDLALDTLAKMLRILGPEDWQKDHYFESLKRFSPQRFFAGLKVLEESYRPRSKSDFPVIGTVIEACEQANVASKTDIDTWDCRCCGVPFRAANLTGLNCDCYAQSYCYECGQCGKHCNCEHVTPLAESQVWQTVLACVDSPIKQALVKEVTGKESSTFNGTRVKQISELPNKAWTEAKAHWNSRGFKIWRRGDPEPADY